MSSLFVSTLRFCNCAKIMGAALSFAFEVYVAPRYMVWEEYDAGGDRLLREEGWLIALGVAGEGRLLRGSAEVYGGRLAYDGQTQGGTPVQTDTVYSGFRLQGGVGWDLGEEIVFSPRLLYTLEGWVRDIRSTSYALGYREYWSYNTGSCSGMRSCGRIWRVCPQYTPGGVQPSIWDAV